jgi:hypothetical protein
MMVMATLTTFLIMFNNHFVDNVERDYTLLVYSSTTASSGGKTSVTDTYIHKTS